LEQAADQARLAKSETRDLWPQTQEAGTDSHHGCQPSLSLWILQPHLNSGSEIDESLLVIRAYALGRKCSQLVHECLEHSECRLNLSSIDLVPADGQFLDEAVPYTSGHRYPASAADDHTGNQLDESIEGDL
jgi:hypothetical protein